MCNCDAFEKILLYQTRHMPLICYYQGKHEFLCELHNLKYSKVDLVSLEFGVELEFILRGLVKEPSPPCASGQTV